ncbi:MAG: hypothetical protein V1862_00615 [Methanobacteriota archaeon]
MMKPIFSGIAGVVFGLILILTMINAKEWYLYPVLLIGYLFLWRYGPLVTAWWFTQLMVGEVATVAAFHVSLIYGVILQSSVVAIFLLQLNILVSRSEWFWFFLFTGSVVASAFLLDLSRDILIPIGIILLAGGIAVVYVLFDEYRVVRMYRSDLK